MTVTVTAGAVVDGVNNGNLEASEAFSVDTKAPTVSSVDDQLGFGNGCGPMRRGMRSG